MNYQEALDLAILHHQSGNLREAEKGYREILSLNPDHADALNLLGVISMQAGRLNEAVDLISRAIAINSGFGDYYCNLSEAHRRLGHLDRAVALARRAIEINPQMPEAFINLGAALSEIGRNKDAIAAYRKVTELSPHHPTALRNLGSALRRDGQLDEAITVLNRAIELKPHFVEAYIELGNAFSDQRNFVRAVECYRRATQCDPKSAEAHCNLGNSLAALDRFDEALSAYQTAIELKPDFALAHTNLGKVLPYKGEFQAAVRALEKAVQVNPQSSFAHQALAVELLRLGDFRRGLPEYEWRREPLSAVLSKTPNSGPQRWDGSDIRGRTIFIHGEQGFGDNLQFVRYVPMIAKLGGRVILGCRPELRRLFEGCLDVDKVISDGDPFPKFDCHCPMASLPLAFATELETIPASVPYLKADPGLIQAWANVLGPRDGLLRVGLAWAGNPDFEDDRRRSLTLAQLNPLADAHKAVFCSLQKGQPALQLAAAPRQLKLIDLGSELTDFADTAAAMYSLDLIITTDTSIAHLAGALGLRVWVMLPFVPAWRWLIDREDSPWYPTMRLFRQRTSGDWAEVIDRVAKSLVELQDSD
jgi:tetratricopeptide (TPR) repeat protein